MTNTTKSQFLLFLYSIYSHHFAFLFLLFYSLLIVRLHETLFLSHISCFSHISVHFFCFSSQLIWPLWVCVWVCLCSKRSKCMYSPHCGPVCVSVSQWASQSASLVGACSCTHTYSHRMILYFILFNVLRSYTLRVIVFFFASFHSLGSFSPSQSLSNSILYFLASRS